MILGYISAHMNPAVCLTLLILGKINGTEFVAAVGGEFLGAFVGAVLVWLHYLPHFKTVPTPYSTDADNLLLKGDPVSQTALGIGSYNVRADDILARRRGLGDIAHAFEDIKYYLKGSYRLNTPVENHSTLVEVALGPDEVKDTNSKTHADRLRRRSVQVCDVHRRLKDVDIQDFKSMLIGFESHQSPSMMNSSSANMRTSAAHLDNTNPNPNAGAGAASRNTVSWNSSAGDLANAPTTLNVNISPDSAGQQQKQEFELGTDVSIPAHSHNHSRHPSSPSNPMVEQRRQHLEKLYEAAVVADRNVKLSIFCTRPAIYSPPFNFLCEFMSTTALIYGALMIYARRDLLDLPERSLFRSLEGIWIGFFVFLLILGLGGPTGIAANPARDFSPRVAHALLPIAGKGKSEFYYSWIPFFAPLVGSCAAAGLYHATQLLNNSQVSSD
jgi:glycerol uptake facilitator-like aquaporin